MNQPLRSPLDRQRGLAAVEFAITSIILFTFLFGVFEMARLSFVWATLSQATDSAAHGLAMRGFTSSDRDTVRQQAIFVNAASAPMPLTKDIKYDNLVVDYLDSDRNPVASADLPTCQIVNVMNCLENPDGSKCVRYVRVRLCQSGTNCTPVQFHPLIALPAFIGLNISMPNFTAVVPLEAQALPGDCS